MLGLGGEAETIYTGGGIWLLRVPDAWGTETSSLRGWSEWSAEPGEHWSGSHYPAGVASGSGNYDGILLSDLGAGASPKAVARMVIRLAQRPATETTGRQNRYSGQPVALYEDGLFTRCPHGWAHGYHHPCLGCGWHHPGAFLLDCAGCLRRRR